MMELSEKYASAIVSLLPILETDDAAGTYQ